MKRKVIIILVIVCVVIFSFWGINNKNKQELEVKKSNIEEYVKNVCLFAENIGFKSDLVYEFDSDVVNDNGNLEIKYKISEIGKDSITCEYDEKDNIISYEWSVLSDKFLEYYPYISTAILNTIDKDVFDKDKAAEITLNLLKEENISMSDEIIIQYNIKYLNYDISLTKMSFNSENSYFFEVKKEK